MSHVLKKPAFCKYKCHDYLNGKLTATVFHIIHVMKEESGKFLFHFKEIFEKCIEYIGKILDSFQGGFEFLLKTWYNLKEF